MGLGDRKCPTPDSLAGMPEGAHTRKKVIKISGIPGMDELKLEDKKKIQLEILTANGEKVIGHLELGSISYWREPDEAGKGRRMYWENFQKWMEFANQPKKREK